ncbi:MAG: type II toxin-antitoxin system Y4mF family antitoxin [bacterium]|nr:type II toxin-antitoxin system Y4mF family antitoxin [bacterium]
MKVAEFVKLKRKEYRLTQIELAEKSGVGLRFLRELEQGKSTLRMDKVNQVLEMFSSTLVVGEMERNLSYAEG